MKLAALVPMRHHSQRVPGKNYRPLAGKPLFHHIIETLLAVPEIETVMVDTDSEPVMDGVRRLFPTVKLIERPEHLRADDVPMNDILLLRHRSSESGFLPANPQHESIAESRNDLARSQNIFCRISKI